jgi:hypothetical protein
LEGLAIPIYIVSKDTSDIQHQLYDAIKKEVRTSLSFIPLLTAVRLPPQDSEDAKKIGGRSNCP